MPKKSISNIKKKLKLKNPKISKVSKRPIGKQKEEKKPFKFEFDDFIIENAPERIKMFAKPDANLQGEKQFKIKITKDETGKAQFDIIFVKSPEEEIGNIVQKLHMPSEEDIMTSIMVSPDDNKIDLIKSKSISSPSQADEPSPSVISETSTMPAWVKRPDPNLNFLQTQYQKERDHKGDVGNYVHINNIKRYQRIRAQLLKEHREKLQSNDTLGFPNTDNVQHYPPYANLEYDPNDFAESTKYFDRSSPSKPSRKDLPVSQLRSDSTDTYIIKDEEGRKYLVKPLHHEDIVSNEPHYSKDSKYVPHGESKKINTKSNQTVQFVHNIGAGGEKSWTKNIGCGSKEICNTDRKILTLDAGTCMDPPDVTFVVQNNIGETLRDVVEIESAVENNNGAIVRPYTVINLSTSKSSNDIQINQKPLSNPEENQTSLEMSPQSSNKTFPSDMNFIISSACEKMPKSKQVQVREVVSEILDYFDSDLIKSLMAQKIEDEREFIIKFMNHRGKYGKFLTIYIPTGT